MSSNRFLDAKGSAPSEGDIPKRNLRDHSIATGEGSGMLDPYHPAGEGISGAVATFIALSLAFMFFSFLYLIYRVYYRGKKYVPKKGLR